MSEIMIKDQLKIEDDKSSKKLKKEFSVSSSRLNLENEILHDMNMTLASRESKDS